MVTVGEKIEIDLKDMDLRKWKSELEDDKKHWKKSKGNSSYKT